MVSVTEDSQRRELCTAARQRMASRVKGGKATFLTLTVVVDGLYWYGNVARVAPTGVFLMLRGGNTGGTMLVPVDKISAYTWGKVAE